MKQRIILFGLILVGTVTFAQSPEEKGLNTINRSSAEATIGFLASDELQGREAGFHGSYVSSEYIASILQWMGIQPLNESYFQPFDAYRKERQKKGRLEVHPDSVAKLKQEVHQKLSMRNVLAMIPGKNTKEYVIVGAHFDHLGIDPALDGDQIYNGADDNASGVSAVLQIARAFLASGQQPERNVIFAFWLKCNSLFFGCVENECSSTNCHNSTIFNPYPVFVSQNFIHEKCSSKARSVPQCINELSLLVTLYVDNTVTAIHTHISAFDRGINDSSYTTTPYHIITFLQW